MQATITEGAEVTPSQVRQFYKDIPEDSLPLINTEVVVQQIVRYPKVTAAAKQSAIDKLNGFLERVEGGSSFSTLAILYRGSRECKERRGIQGHPTRPIRQGI